MDYFGLGNMFGAWPAGTFLNGMALSNGTALSGNMALLNSMAFSAQLAPTYAKFTDALHNAVSGGQAFRAGEDVILSYPPRTAAGYEVDKSKAAADMSLDEYKRYIINKISDLPVSGSCRMNCNGILVLKEEAFENMQKDPAYEKEVMNMLQKGFQAQYPFYSANPVCQVIGGSAEECSAVNVGEQGASQEKSLREQWRERWQEQERRQSDSLGQSGRRGSLADRLAANRAYRRSQRMADRQSDGWTL